MPNAIDYGRPNSKPRRTRFLLSVAFLAAAALVGGVLLYREILGIGLARRAGLGATLIAAVQTGDAAKVRQALSGGADPNTGSFPNTLLATAVGRRDVPVAKLLIEFGARQGLYDPSPLMIALRDKDGALIHLLITKPADGSGQEAAQDILHVAIRLLNAEEVRLLLENGANPNQSREFSRRPLDYAVEAGSKEIVFLLRAAGADPNLPDDDGVTPLQRAQRSHPEMMSCLTSPATRPAGR